MTTHDNNASDVLTSYVLTNIQQRRTYDFNHHIMNKLRKPTPSSPANRGLSGPAPSSSNARTTSTPAHSARSPMRPQTLTEAPIVPSYHTTTPFVSRTMTYATADAALVSFKPSLPSPPVPQQQHPALRYPKAHAPLPMSPAEQYWAARALTAETLLSAAEAHQREVRSAVDAEEEKRLVGFLNS